MNPLRGFGFVFIIFSTIMKPLRGIIPVEPGNSSQQSRAFILIIP